MCLLPDAQMWHIYAFSGILAWLTLTIIYHLFFHPLAKVPGPLLPAITYLYASYFYVICSGQFYKEVERLHNKFGPIVRITPNEVHLSDPENYDKIYNMSTHFYKDPNFYDALGLGYATFSTIPNDLHRARR
ncbi:hypothetical protein AOQ84DRAFT_418860, partial [Glonium stellatum]